MSQQIRVQRAEGSFQRTIVAIGHNADPLQDDFLYFFIFIFTILFHFSLPIQSMNIVCWGKFSWHRDRETSNQAHKPNKTERQTPRYSAGTKPAALYNICAVPGCWLTSRDLDRQMDSQMDSQTARQSGRKQKLRFVSATSKGGLEERELRAPFRPIFFL